LNRDVTCYVSTIYIAVNRRWRRGCLRCGS